LIQRDNAVPTNEVGTIDVEQITIFAFLRDELSERNIYPEVGDIIEFDSQYYEINNTNETQLVAGQTLYNHQILCDCHLMRKVPVQLEKPLM